MEKIPELVYQQDAGHRQDEEQSLLLRRCICSWVQCAFFLLLRKAWRNDNIYRLCPFTDDEYEMCTKAP